MKLTKRESDLLRLLCQGIAGKRAADILGVKHSTVENYLNNMHQKFKVRTTLEMVCMAFRSHLPEAGLTHETPLEAA